MGSILAPGSMLLPDTLIPTNQLWAGNPAIYIRDVSDAEVDKTEKVFLLRMPQLSAPVAHPIAPLSLLLYL